MTTFNRKTVVAILIVGAFCIQGTPVRSQQEAAQNAASPASTNPDREFAKKAAAGGVAEVKLGQLAMDKATSDTVKNFGKRMMDDHRKANEQLKRTAARENIELPTEMNEHDQDVYNRLSQLSGAEFDKAYARDMVSDHKQDIATFKTESDNGKDQAIKDFAFRTLPTLETHMKLAREMMHELEPGSPKPGGNK